ncbi:hypothetical protein KF840_12455 [bacterium]|nr:hypothetical protein [bacterium]
MPERSARLVGARRRRGRLARAQSAIELVGHDLAHVLRNAADDEVDDALLVATVVTLPGRPTLPVLEQAIDALGDQVDDRVDDPLLVEVAIVAVMIVAMVMATAMVVVTTVLAVATVVAIPAAVAVLAVVAAVVMVMVTIVVAVPVAHVRSLSTELAHRGEAAQAISSPAGANPWDAAPAARGRGPAVR